MATTKDLLQRVYFNRTARHANFEEDAIGACWHHVRFLLIASALLLAYGGTARMPLWCTTSLSKNERFRVLREPDITCWHYPKLLLAPPKKSPLPEFVK